MSQELNPIAPSIENFPMHPSWAVGSPRLSATYNVSAQGYPPNTSSHIVNVKLPKTLTIEPGESAVIGDVVQFIDENMLFGFLQAPFLPKGTQPKIATIRLSDAIVHDIDELMAGREDETAPTEFAYSNARRVIESAYGKARITGKVSPLPPRPLATTDDLGGIRLLWNLGPRNIRLNFGAAPDRQSYLYYEAGLDHGVEPLNDENLVKRLDWLTGR